MSLSIRRIDLVLANIARIFSHELLVFLQIIVTMSLDLRGLSIVCCLHNFNPNNRSSMLFFFSKKFDFFLANLVFFIIARKIFLLHCCVPHQTLENFLFSFFPPRFHSLGLFFV